MAKAECRVARLPTCECLQIGVTFGWVIGLLRAVRNGPERFVSNVLMRLRCMIWHHSPSRRKMHYDGHLKSGPCKYCGMALEKAANGLWLLRRES
jgi:hypothetical protein